MLLKIEKLLLIILLVCMIGCDSNKANEIQRSKIIKEYFPKFQVETDSVSVVAEFMGNQTIKNDKVSFYVLVQGVCVNISSAGDDLKCNENTLYGVCGVRINAYLNILIVTKDKIVYKQINAIPKAFAINNNILCIKCLDPFGDKRPPEDVVYKLINKKLVRYSEKDFLNEIGDTKIIWIPLKHNVHEKADKNIPNDSTIDNKLDEEE